MNSSKGNPESAGSPTRENEELTGLPRLRTWRGVYLFVFGCFVLWRSSLVFCSWKKDARRWQRPVRTWKTWWPK